MTENIIKLDLNSFQDMCKTIEELTKENQDLKLDNDFLQRQNKALKLRCGKYCLQIRDLESENADLKFSKNFLTDTAEENFIANGEAHYEKFAFIGDDF